MAKVRLVLDTNVIVSAVVKPDGLQTLTFQIALSPFCELFVSAPILSEYEEVLSKRP
jgi:predicted nucleic acid-binding protein